MRLVLIPAVSEMSLTDMVYLLFWVWVIPAFLPDVAATVNSGSPGKTFLPVDHGKPCSSVYEVPFFLWS
jgi:hypothetical protein